MSLAIMQESSVDLPAPFGPAISVSPWSMFSSGTSSLNLRRRKSMPRQTKGLGSAFSNCCRQCRTARCDSSGGHRSSGAGSRNARGSLPSTGHPSTKGCRPGSKIRRTRTTACNSFGRSYTRCQESCTVALSELKLRTNSCQTRGVAVSAGGGAFVINPARSSVGLTWLRAAGHSVGVCDTHKGEARSDRKDDCGRNCTRRADFPRHGLRLTCRHGSCQEVPDAAATTMASDPRGVTAAGLSPIGGALPSAENEMTHGPSLERKA